jgi:hypothetical protein
LENNNVPFGPWQQTGTPDLNGIQTPVMLKGISLNCHDLQATGSNTNIVDFELSFTARANYDFSFPRLSTEIANAYNNANQSFAFDMRDSTPRSQQFLNAWAREFDSVHRNIMSMSATIYISSSADPRTFVTLQDRNAQCR